MKRFFSYDDQNEFELHDTLAEAKAAAEKAFEHCSDEARSEGWPESVDDICYGELRGHVVETLRQPWDTDKHGVAPEEGCEYAEYALHDLPHNTEAAPLSAVHVDALVGRAASEETEMVGYTEGIWAAASPAPGCDAPRIFCGARDAAGASATARRGGKPAGELQRISKIRGVGCGRGGTVFCTGA